MTLQDRVHAFVALRAPRPICDDCVADYLALSRKQVLAAAFRFKQLRAVRRFTGRCSGCCTNRRVNLLA